MDTTSLKEAGLTEGETKVYIALLELGSSTTGPIIDKSKISRSIIYQILEKLMEKGLASYITKDKTKYYQAAEPTKIIQYIEKRKKEYEENKKQVERLLPELLMKQKMAVKSEANFYTGFKGLRTAHEHTYLKLKKGEEYTFLGIPAYQPKEQHLYWKKDHTRREKAGIKCKLLFNQDTDPKIIKQRNSYKGCEARHMPTDIKTTTAFLIYKNTTTIMLQAPTGMAVEIVNQKVADSFKEYFNEFWKKSKPFKNTRKILKEFS